jgi:glycerol-1-phosphatase
MALSGLNTPVIRAQTPTVTERAADMKTPSLVLDVSAILSDMDGTLIDSTAAITQHWTEVGAVYGISHEQILATSHGRRSIDVFQQIDPSKATWEHVCELEAAVPRRFGGTAVEIKGARVMLEALHAQGRYTKWAVVTSGTRGLVAGWLDVLGLAKPECIVTAEDVVQGKPKPECYLLAAKKLGLCTETHEIGRALVLEDAPAGIKAGKAAGCLVLGLATTHSVEALQSAGADWVVQDLRSLTIGGAPAQRPGLLVKISNIIG